MPCNLAMTITKAAVSEDRLRALLTADVVTTLLTSYLQEKHIALIPDSFRATHPGPYASLQAREDGSVQCRIGGYYGMDIFVQAGQVTVTGTTTTQQPDVDQMLQEVTHLLAQATDALFARQVQMALTALGVPMTTEQVQVEQAGQVSPAIVFTVRVS